MATVSQTDVGSSHKASAWSYIGAIVALTAFGIPVIWLILTALASPSQISEGTAGLLDIHPRWQNFVDAV